jgi:predicted GNAT family N-acyltransferase
MTTSTLRAAQVEVACILDLRWKVLRQGLPRTMASFDGDDAPGTLHWALLEGDDPVCCLTLLPSVWEGAPAWQLRGMASAPGRQRQGLGRRLVQASTDHARGLQPAWTFWCNARLHAVPFYEGLGWQVCSDVFDIEHAGPHVRMTWKPT